MATSIVICGAGIAGISTAYYLLKNNCKSKVVLVDKNQPLSFTTSKSGENYRDYWPQECMQNFVSRSILLMKDLRLKYGSDSFKMIESGYNFISHHKENPIFDIESNDKSKALLEKIDDTAIIQRDYPYLDKKIAKIIKIKNAGKIDVYDLGNLLLREAKKMGLQFIQSEVLSISKINGDYKVNLASKETLNASKIVISSGPFINTIANMLDLHFPVINTLQRKFIIPDPKNIIPKNMPFTIYADSQKLNWSKDEIAFFSSDEKLHWLLQEFPGGLHIKPETEGIKLGWAFQTESEIPEWHPKNFDLFPQAVLKGASRFIPELAAYEEDIPTPIIEYAGYYTRTKENWPIIGPTKEKNVFVVGALAGYGTMSACAAGELCANHILKSIDLPSYAEYFHPLKYENPKIMNLINNLKSDGQL
ncbi:NAD(P)/FAD-dependent oxidoreductase [Polaribacter glomeratus]|uniref:FAD dependent oxidoreductase domain-containing protein n=1 Tax=Polaribacter glomeratus TaxID=102 RepID=A0A2S7WV80_9FLAO|nr:FAD-dependent oxidoreductase [Polaribacter glomeratus]PQJ81458.1 hypothetical protein BTO16_02190 [Polaribacter glomeratus]TXD64740.1 FAD-binding oxidoreductase [Polaribacter glomeratus]